MKHWFVDIIGGLMVVLGVATASAQTGDLFAIEKHINSYQVEKAEDEIAHLSAAVKDSPRGKYVRARFLFYVGKYGKADALLKEAVQEERTELDWKYLSDQVASSLEETATLKMEQPQKGFTFYYRNGNDSILVPYALKSLIAQRRRLQQTLGDEVKDIRVYILPSVEMLSRLCGLSSEQIEATGTVAISKYNRIMILSPNLIVGGYPWLDTLAHELTHLSITRVSSNRAPIWLHEGIAKLLEAQWRGLTHSDLTPVLAYLLDQAVHEKRLIPLRRFHPSVSYLPNQEDAALAYAQGLSFLQFVVEQFREGNTLQTLLESIGTGNLDTAFEATAGYPTQKLYRWWQESLMGTRNAPAALVPLMHRRFKTLPGAAKANIDPILDREVRRHIRVGDLLRLRGHIDAAAKEYQWALEKNEAMTPDIVDRLASVLLAQNLAPKALELLTPMKSLYPNHATVFVQAGEAYTRSGQKEKAAQELNRVIALNPFHPEVHCMLSAIYADSGDTQLAEQEKSHCLKLGTASP